MSGKKAIMFSFGVVMSLNVLHNSPLFAGELKDNSITIVYNNVPGNTAVEVQVGGGFSAFIVFDQKRILFDVGGDASTLINNVSVLGLDLSNLDAVLISHNHWDHVYGIPGVYAFVESNPGVYVPRSAKEAISQQYPRANVISIEGVVEIFPRVWSTGPIDMNYRGMPFSEQALVLNSGDGLYIITGCAHPGIVEIVERVKQMFPEQAIALVTGGFHLANKTDEEIREISARLRKLGVEKIAPSHCTGRTAMEIFESEWGTKYLQLYLGNTYRF
jgi:7,8-dihydropterin-6-yl-methyl-4-(beta-D-ribofuranosyl)aminobenzene 5'-phosphate synthase